MTVYLVVFSGSECLCVCLFSELRLDRLSGTFVTSIWRVLKVLWALGGGYVCLFNLLTMV